MICRYIVEMSFKLHAKTLAGNLYTLTVTPSQSIKMVKRMLLNKIIHDSKRPAYVDSSSTLKLIAFQNATELSDFKTIGDYPFLKNNDELVLTIEVDELYADISVQLNDESLKLITTPFYRAMTVTEFKQSIAEQLQEDNVTKKIMQAIKNVEKQTKTFIPPSPKHMAHYNQLIQKLYDLLNVLGSPFELYVGKCASKNNRMENNDKISAYEDIEEGVNICIEFEGFEPIRNKNNNSNRNSNSNSNRNYNSNGGKRRKTRRTKHRKSTRRVRKN